MMWCLAILRALRMAVVSMIVVVLSISCVSAEGAVESTPGASNAESREGEASSATFFIGLMVPNAGPERDRGEALRNGATLAVDSINVAGGIHGAKLALQVEETTPDPRAQVKAFSNMAGRSDIPAVILIGEDDASVVKGIAQVNQTLIFSNSIRGDSTGAHSYTIRIGRPVTAAAKAVYQLLKERKVTRVAAAEGDLPWVSGAAANLKEVLNKTNIDLSLLGQIWNRRGFPSEIFTDKLKRLKPEMVYLLSFGKDQQRAVDAIHAAEVSIPLVTLFACSDEVVAKEVSSYGAPVYSIDVAVDQGSSLFTEMSERFANRFPKAPLTLDTLIGYDTVKMIAAAFEKGAGNSAAMRDFILAQKAFKGAAGEISFDEAGESVRPLVVNAVHGQDCRQVIDFGEHGESASR